MLSCSPIWKYVAVTVVGYSLIVSSTVLLEKKVMQEMWNEPTALGTNSWLFIVASPLSFGSSRRILFITVYDEST